MSLRETALRKELADWYYERLVAVEGLAACVNDAPPSFSPAERHAHGLDRLRWLAADAADWERNFTRVHGSTVAETIAVLFAEGVRARRAEAVARRAAEDEGEALQ